MFQQFIKSHDLPNFRLNQLRKHYYQDLYDSFDKFTTLSKNLRDLLKQELTFNTITLVKKLVSSNHSTVKYLFKRQSDNQVFETVLMKHNDGRNTICVSCMIGCPVGCTFCATGKMGFLGNLNHQEIIDQVLTIARQLHNQDSPEKVTNIVFMGMGEPLLNIDNVIDAINILTDPKKFALGIRRITISTAGYIAGINKLIEANYKGKLALSLHAPTQSLREQIMPTAAKANDLSELMIILRKFQDFNSNRISFEYILIKNLTDSEKNAEQLTNLIHKSHIIAHINLIPYNKVAGVDYQVPDTSTVTQFSDYLALKNISNTIRVTMGADVDAACGQLANTKLKT